MFGEWFAPWWKQCGWQNSSHREGRGGFTLLELLLSMALIALLMAGAWRAMSLYEEIFTEGQSQVEAVQVIRSIEEQLAADLRGAIPDVSDQLTGAMTVRRFGCFGTSRSLQIDLIEVVPSQFVFDTATGTDPYSEALSGVGSGSGSVASGSLGGGLTSSGTSLSTGASGGGFGLDMGSGFLDTERQSIAHRVPELSTVRWQFYDWVDFEAVEGLTLIDLLAINAGLEPINAPTGDSDAFMYGFLVSDLETATDTSELFGGSGAGRSMGGTAGGSGLGGSAISSSGGTTSSAGSGGGRSTSGQAVSDGVNASGGTTRFRFDRGFAAASQSGAGAILVGLVRRQIDWETPLDPEAATSGSESGALSSGTSSSGISLGGTLSDASSDEMSDEDLVTDLLGADFSSLASTANTTGSTGGSGMPTSALEQRRIRMLFHPDDPNVTWFPEVIGAEFQYYDGSGWASEWNSLTRRSLPVAVVVRLQVLPRRPLSAKDLASLRNAIIDGYGNTTVMDGMIVGEADDTTGDYAVGLDYTSVLMGTTGDMNRNGTSVSSGGTSGGTLSGGAISSGSSGGLSGNFSIGSGTLGAGGSAVGTQVGSGTSSSGSGTFSGASPGELTGRPIVRGAKYYQFLLPLPATAMAREVSVAPSIESMSPEDPLEPPQIDIPEPLTPPTITPPTVGADGGMSSTATGTDQWIRTQ